MMLVIIEKEINKYDYKFEPSLTFAPSPTGDVYVMFCTSKLVSELSSCPIINKFQHSIIENT